jgi:hypothetical protein
VATLNAAVQDVASTDYISGIISTGNNGGWGLIYDPTTTIKGYWVDASGQNGAFSNENTRDVKIVTGLVGKTTNSYIYVNSQLKGNRTAQSIAHSSADNIYVGVRGNASNRKFIGNISEVFMFPKTLTAEEQTALETSQSIFIGPFVTIASSASGAVSAGTSVTFTATTYNFSGTPSYQWYKNGAVISGETNASYTTSTLANADQIYVIASAVTSNSLNANITAGPSAIVSMLGDGCINKTTLSTPAGQTSYIWYKDNVAISNTNSNTYLPTTAGDYKVQVTSGSCSTQSTITTISTCGVTADGRMQAITTPTTLVSHEGGINFGTGVSELGTTVNATGISTTLGTIGATTAVVSGVISATNARTTSIGVIYSTDSNFGTYSTSSTQSNVAAGTYASTLTGLSSLTNYYAKAFITNKAGTSYGPVVSFTTSSPPKAVGDVYQGGIIFYVLQSGDSGYDASVQHGLIAPFNSISRMSTNPLPPIIESQIGKFAATISGAQADGLLVGKTNTDAIIVNQGSTGTYAALYCRNYANPTSKTFNSVTYTFPVYNDWYLPTIAEINKFRAYVWGTHPSRGTYTNYGSMVIYYTGTSGNGNDYAWGKYLSSSMTGQNYKLYYLESGNQDGSTAYNGWSENDRLVVMPVRSF